MKNFAVYDTTTGNIKRAGLCDDADMMNQPIANDGSEAILDTSASATPVVVGSSGGTNYKVNTSNHTLQVL